MSYLLDVNVLIALIDRDHEHHKSAHGWLSGDASTLWATCAITEMAVIRIVSNPSYANHLDSPAIAADLLSELRYMRGHIFWSDMISPLDDRYFNIEEITSHKQTTDVYLLGLAVAYKSRLATFDRHINPAPVIGGREALHVLNR